MAEEDTLDLDLVRTRLKFRGTRLKEHKATLKTSVEEDSPGDIDLTEISSIVRQTEVDRLYYNEHYESLTEGEDDEDKKQEDSEANKLFQKEVKAVNRFCNLLMSNWNCYKVSSTLKRTITTVKGLHEADPTMHSTNHLKMLKEQVEKLERTLEGTNLDDENPLMVEAHKLILTAYTMQATLCHSTYATEIKPAIPMDDSLGSTKMTPTSPPEFSGHQKDWLPFWSEFEAIHLTKKYTQRNKLGYLRNAMKDAELRRQITNSIENNETYAEVVKALLDQFDRPRVLHKIFVNQLLNMPKVELTRTSIMKAVNSLESIWNGLKKMGQCDAQSIFTTVAEALLPRELEMKWADQTMEVNEVPPIQDLIKFLKLRSKQSQYDVKQPDPTPAQGRKAPFRAKPAGSQGSVHVTSAQPAQKPSYQPEPSGAPSHQASVPKTKSPMCPPCRYTCPLCNESHYAYFCKVFKAKSVDQRQQHVTAHSLCTKCLKPGHGPDDCRNKHTCHTCQGNHNSLLHGASLGSSQPPTTTGTSNVMHTTSSTSTQGMVKLLMTCKVMAIGPTGRSMPTRCLIDSGADVSAMLTPVSTYLKVALNKPLVTITTFGGGPPQHCKSGEITLACMDGSAWRHKMIVVVVDKITDNHPRADASAVRSLPGFKELTPADPTFDRPGRIDILLGTDVIPFIMDNGHSWRMDDVLISKMKFGHGFSGAIPEAKPILQKATVQVVTSRTLDAADDQLNASLIRFWEVEQPPKEAPAFTPEETRVKNEYELTHSFISHAGRYQVQLPKKQNKLKLGDSHSTALRRYHSNERALLRKGQHQPFQEVVQEYVDMDHARLVTAEELQLPASEVFYLPMHGVHKITSSTTKLRIVFDASAQSSSGVSLNDTLAVGPTLHPRLEQILLNFRTWRVALSGDIRKMYREILLRPADRQLHRFLWRASPDQEVQSYCINRVTFGVASSPYLAVQTLQQAGRDFGKDWPIAQHHIDSSFYVDDLLGGANSDEEVIQLYEQLTNILSKAGFTLRKFRSSSPQVLSQIPAKLVEAMPTKTMTDCHSASYPKALGVVWNSTNDTMSTAINKPENFNPTKRGILSDVSKTFDVMGWITPVILPMKILMQKLWKTNKDWDDEISPELAQQHQAWREELYQLEDCALPRCYFAREATQTIHLHGFCDASQKAFGAVIYIRATYLQGPPTCRLVIAKSRVAPTNTRTLPQLELCAAVLLTQLMQATRKTLGIEAEQVTAWGDSTVVLCWLTKCPSSYETFVANRITTVISSIPASQWHHVPSQENPADCASRGVSALELKEHPLWWNGPPWLLAEPILMPRQPLEEELEKQKHKHLKASVNKCLVVCSAPAEWLVTRSMSLRTLTRTTAWLKRAVFNFKALLQSQPRNTDPQLTVEEIKEATILLLNRSQRRSFTQELHGLTLTPPEPIPATNRLIHLRPFLGNEGLLRIGGRLKHSDLPYKQKHPILLSARDPLTRVIFLSKHLTMSHCGPTLLLSSVGTDYYVKGAKKLAQNVSQGCVVCKKVSSTVEQQLMGQLPRDRVTESPGFHTVGVDYGGPFKLKSSNLRNAPKIESYLCVFVCFATKGVHLEVVLGLTTEAFLAALRRFIGRRGQPRHIYSDNGGNFVGAKNDLEALYKGMNKVDMCCSLKSFFVDHQTTYHNIPERAPHFGGLWESAVKSAKYHLRRVIGDQVLTYEEMSTVAIQVEACLNSRPILEQYSHAIDGIQPLTPAHLLIGKILTAYPETDLDFSRSYRDRWTLCQSMVQQFWRRWSTEYLSQLQSRKKWTSTRPNLAVGDLVLMNDSKSFFTTHWGMARVAKLFPGEDGLVRAVDVTVCKIKLPKKKPKELIKHQQMKVKTTTFRRPVAKLCLLIPNERDLSLGGECSGMNLPSPSLTASSQTAQVLDSDEQELQSSPSS